MASTDSQVPDIDAKPFANFQINDWHVLEAMDSRSSCPKCGKSRKYFCYTCYVPVTGLEGKIPRLKLPIKVDIIKHAKEIDGKSTSAHAAVLAPEDVTIYTFPCIPDYDHTKERIILVFPGKEAVTIEDFIHESERISSASRDSSSKRPHSPGVSSRPIDRAIFIDSTWNQCKGIYKDSRLKDLPCVVLNQRITQFWRHQEGSPRWYLATIEAVHQLLVEMDSAVKKVSLGTPKKVQKIGDGSDVSESDERAEVSHKFDNLLFFFKFMYEKIHTLYDHEKLKSYKRPMK